MLISRRSLLESISSSGALRALGLMSVPALVRSQAEVTPEIATFSPEMEPLVSLIERTPRDKSAIMLAAQLKAGVSYRELMAALFLAGVRNINPRPPGFALHSVFVIHAAHLISLQAPSDSRLLPLFYALDIFKSSQERDANAKTGDYVMRALHGATPSASALPDFTAAMEAWDSERAERAVVAIARYRNAAEAFEQLWRYGARDYRNIGHKAIFVANAERTLRTIGWQHSEPVLRSLVLGLLDFGKEQQINGYAFTDQCYAANLKRVSSSLPRLDAGWAARPADAAVTRSILKEIRTASPDQACAAVAERLVKGVAGPASIWDAAHLAANELRMRVSAGATITGVHAVTSCNGLHHAYLSATEPAARLLVLLQAVGWMGQFRAWAETRKENVRTFAIDDMEPSLSTPESETSIADVFENLGSKLDDSAARAMRLAQTVEGQRALLTTATRLTLAKADEVHFYKYLAALIEDTPLVSAQWRPHMASTAIYYCKGSSDTEPTWTQRARAALDGKA